MVIKSIIGVTCACFTAVSINVNAALTDNGDGTITQLRNDGSVVMWLTDANTTSTSGYCDISGNCYSSNGYMTWVQAKNWIDALNSSNYLGYNDWRLPHILPINGSSYDKTQLGHDGSKDWGYNMSAPGTIYEGGTNSEMAYMYYFELGNLGYYDTSGQFDPNYGLNNTGPFTNIQTNFYWSGSEDTTRPGSAWVFSFGSGGQGNGNDVDILGSATPDVLYAWAVRDGTALPPTPEELIAELVNTVISLNINRGISNALDSKLENVLAVLEDANQNSNTTAINMMNAFIYSVEAQSGNQITEADATALIAAANGIIDSLNQ